MIRFAVEKEGVCVSVERDVLQCRVLCLWNDRFTRLDSDYCACEAPLPTQALTPMEADEKAGLEHDVEGGKWKYHVLQSEQRESTCPGVN